MSYQCSLPRPCSILYTRYFAMDTATTPVENATSKNSPVDQKLSDLYAFLTGPSFPSLTVVLTSAILLSILSTLLFYPDAFHIAHFDAKGHLLVPRRIIDNLTPGWIQIGAFWLPLPHVLYLPFVQNDFLYFSGLAGTPVSMFSYVLTIYFLYRLIELVFDRAAAFGGSVLYLTNPNILYLQTSSLTENLAILFLIWSTYLLVHFVRSKRKSYLVSSSIVCSLGILTRYENWFSFAFMGLFILFWTWKEKRGWKNLIYDCFLFGTPGVLAMAVTFLINYLTTGAYYHEHSIKHTDFQPARGSFLMAFGVILYTIGNLISFDWVVFALLAAVVLFRRRFRDSSFLASLALLAPLVLYLLEYRDNHPTRIRYGLMFLPGTVFLLSFWSGKSRFITFLFIVLLFHVAWSSPFARFESSELLMESLRDTQKISLQTGVVSYIREHDDGNLILGSMGSIAPSMYDMKLPVRRIVHEGAKPYWNDARKHPEKIVGWVLISQDDPLWNIFHDDPEFHRHFELVAKGGVLELYRRSPDEERNIKSHPPHALDMWYHMPNLPGI